MINSHSTAPSVTNTVSSMWLKNMTDDEIRSGIASQKDAIIQRHFPGTSVQGDAVRNLNEALQAAGADFTVGKRPIFTDLQVAADGGTVAREIVTHKATFNERTGDTLGVVGANYGVVQFSEAFAAIDILAARGDLQIKAVEKIDHGSRVRVTALLGETVLPSVNGAANTLGHFAVFEASHDMACSVTASVYTLRLECFNGMTSREVVQTHKVRHTSKASDRMAEYTRTLLGELIGDAEAEVELFTRLTQKRLTARDFADFATEWLGGDLEEEASNRKTSRRERDIEELLGYWAAGNEGAGQTAWGAYQSVTRYIEAKRERMEDSTKAAKRFGSNVSGAGQKKVAKALRLLTR